ncbi:SAM-dependent methyltransferase [Pseudoramibacter alactolyticus]|jgi:tRNA-Thr(GGU) m(6)t(6)A37 methyltransferase TsaA
MTTITCQPIGIIRTDFTSRENTPRGVAAQNACGVIQMDPQYREAMADMHPGERYLVLFHFDRAKGFAQTVPIHGDGPMTGLFSTRAPNRPNPIGLTAITVESITDTQITFRGADMMDGTPVLDIKPI